MEMKKSVENVMAEELLGRFRSKEDLYRYLVNQSKHLSSTSNSFKANVFLPSMSGTKLSFMRDILSGEKLTLKQNEVNHMTVPNYPEISVKNLYDDAINDPVLKNYLPSKQQLSNKLPERDFFFGIMCTLKQQYMKDIITEAHKNRFVA
jgi:hypothetical protein